MSESIPQDAPMKQCAKCNETFPATVQFFHKHSTSKDGLRSTCCVCRTADVSAKYHAQHPKPLIEDGYKQCRKCKNILPATSEFFCKNSKSKDGLYCYCHECRLGPAYAERLKEVPIPVEEGCKRCARCRQVLAATSDFFCKSTTRKDGLYPYCKECQSIMAHAKYRAKHPSDEPEAVEDGYKWCKQCRQILPTTDFPPRKSTQDGLYSYCQLCTQQYNKQYRDAHRTQESEWRKRYLEDNQDHVRNQWKRYYEENKSTILEKRKRFVEAHKEDVYSLNRKYDHTPHGKVVRRAIRNKRQARKKAAPGVLTPEQIRQKLKAQKFRCYYAACGYAKFEKKNGEYIYHIEHTIPLSRTEHSPRHDVNYIVLACPSCNLSKHSKLPSEWPDGGRLF